MDEGDSWLAESKRRFEGAYERWREEHPEEALEHDRIDREVRRGFYCANHLSHEQLNRVVNCAAA